VEPVKVRPRTQKLLFRPSRHPFRGVEGLSRPSTTVSMAVTLLLSKGGDVDAFSSRQCGAQGPGSDRASSNIVYQWRTQTANRPKIAGCGCRRKGGRPRENCDGTGSRRQPAKPSSSAVHSGLVARAEKGRTASSPAQVAVLSALPAARKAQMGLHGAGSR